VSGGVWHGVAFHDQVLSVCIVGTVLRALPVMWSYAFEVLEEPAISQADAGYPVAEFSGEEALRACVVWCPKWVGVWRVWSFVEIPQGVLLDVRAYCWFCRSCQLVCVLNEWEDVVEYSIDLEM